MTDLSPAAQAVLNAVESDGMFSNYSSMAAAALRAAADQVVPEGWRLHQSVRHELLTIADELASI